MSTLDLSRLAPYSPEGVGRQIRLNCPRCGARRLDLAIGASGRLLASCYSPECSGASVEILKALDMPLGVLAEAEVAHFTEVVGRQALAPAGPPPASASVLDAAYSIWLRLCPLDDEGRADLRRRGFDDAAIARLGYGSWAPERSPAVAQALERFDRVPGVSEGPGVRRVALAEDRYRGLLVPVRDPSGRIVGLKVRLRTPDAEGKMRTFTSAHWGGPAGPYTPHVPRDLPRRAPKVWITEGELKADLVWARLAQPVIGLPGVHGDPSRLTSTLQALGVTSVGLAFDRDASGRAAVLDYQRRLVDTYGLGLVEWDGPELKIDDAVLAGRTIRVRSGADAVDTSEPSGPAPAPSPAPVPVRGPSGPPRALPPKAPVRQATTPAPTSSSSPEPRGLRGGALLRGDWPEPVWIVPDLIPVGVGVLAGKSKIGKSFLVLDLCASVATGGDFVGVSVGEPRPVLYLAFEDTPRGVSKRLRGMLPDLSSVRADLLERNLEVYASNAGVPRMPEGLAWLQARVAAGGHKLVVIDTLERFRPADKTGSAHSYSGDYDLLSSLKGWAEASGLSILLVHHVKKATKDVEDVFDGLLGSTGIIGAPDTLMVLARTRGTVNGRLVAAGREVSHTEIDLEFDGEIGRWSRVLPEEGSASGAESLDSPGDRPDPVRWLREVLASGPVAVADLTALGKQAGWSIDQLKRAKTRAGGIEVRREGRFYVWVLSAPATPEVPPGPAPRPAPGPPVEVPEPRAEEEFSEALALATCGPTDDCPF